jgi:hypothetical protein
VRDNAARAGDLMNRARDAVAIAAQGLTQRPGEEDYRTRFIRYYNSENGRQARNMGDSDGRSVAREAMRGRTGRLKTSQVTPQSLQDQHIGQLYLFAYRSKWFYKDQLPYYDAFPLIFLISPVTTNKAGKMQGDKFLGINFHYLAPRERALLMDAINARLLRNGFDPYSDNYNPRLYARITYQVLRAAARHRAFQPAVKMYLKSNATKMVQIPGDQWESLLFLPLARWRFSNASKYGNAAKNQSGIYRESSKHRN